MAPESDSIPRIALPDLFLTLREFEREPVRKLEDLRLKICSNRKKSPSGDRFWSIARDSVMELQRLRMVDARALPKDRHSYERLRRNNIKITPEGSQILDCFLRDRGAAYDDLFCRMYVAHPYLRSLVKALLRGEIHAPVLTSFKEQVSDRYASAHPLVEDISRKKMDVNSLCEILEKRLRRTLNKEEQASIRDGVGHLLEEWARAATIGEPPVFAKSFLQKLNDVVLSSVLLSDGLGFDFKTHQTLWAFGETWKLWESTARHPDWDLRLIFKTATIVPSASAEAIVDLKFDSGLQETRANFLEKLFNAYQKLQKKNRGTYVVVDELRAVFCYDNRCQESVFDTLVGELYEGSDEYELNMEIYRKSGQHDRPIRIGHRNIGLIRVIKKQQPRLRP
jgi:hypothetical protein